MRQLKQAGFIYRSGLRVTIFSLYKKFLVGIVLEDRSKYGLAGLSNLLCCLPYCMRGYHYMHGTYGYHILYARNRDTDIII